VRRVASSDADRLTALLRLLAAPVVLAGEAVSSAAPERAETVSVLVALLAVYAAVVLVIVHRPSRPVLFDVLLPVIDTAFAVALGLASGGVFSLLFVVFLFAPATTAFQLKPRLTLGVTVLSVAAYLAHALAHPSAHQSGAVELALARALYLSWIGAVLVCLSTLLARRERRLGELVASRRRLVQETLQAEERARARLAGDLHDGVLQSILAVRYAVEEAAEHDDTLLPALDTLNEVTVDMRGVIGQLHPRLLEHLGLRAALAALVRRASERARSVEVTLDADRGGRTAGPLDDHLYWAAQELVANAVAHAGATAITLRLRRGALDDELAVADDGAGFDPAILGDRLREGHIGLLALQERIEGVDGTVTVETSPGAGSTITVRVPATAAAPGLPGSSSADAQPSA
jgi:two-component system, NarL family, sensor kinase